MPGGWVGYADIHLVRRLLGDAQAARSKHRFDAGLVGGPPVGRIAGQVVLDKGHLGLARFLKSLAIVNRAVVLVGGSIIARHRQSLKDEHALRLSRRNVEGQERIPEVVEDA